MEGVCLCVCACTLTSQIRSRGIYELRCFQGQAHKEKQQTHLPSQSHLISRTLGSGVDCRECITSPSLSLWKCHSYVAGSHLIFPKKLHSQVFIRNLVFKYRQIFMANGTLKDVLIQRNASSGYLLSTDLKHLHHTLTTSAFQVRTEIDTEQVFSRMSVESINEHMHVNI